MMRMPIIVLLETSAVKRKKVLGTVDEADSDILSDDSSTRWPRTGEVDPRIVIPPTDSEESASSSASAKPTLKKRRVIQLVRSNRVNVRPKQNIDQVAPKPLAARNIFQHKSNLAAPKISWVPSSRSACLVKAAVGQTEDLRLASVIQSE